MGAFEAKYSGRCADCGEPIEPGDAVIYVSDELVHVECEGGAIITDIRRSRKKADVCTVCWLEMPCACSDGGTAA